MQLPKTILVPTDFSGCAQEALNYAVALAKKLDASLCIVHAWAMPIAAWEGGWALASDVLRDFEMSSRAKLESVVADVRRELPEARSLFANGEPREHILRAARDIKADLIVMGTHGRKAMSRLLMGSVAESVMRHADCPVLAVRHPAED